MEAIETTGKGGPTWMRRALFKEIVNSLARAKGEKVKLEKFIATICVAKGLTEKTVAGMFELMDKAGVVALNVEEDWVKLGGTKE